jgi:predicted glycosyltransferase
MTVLGLRDILDDAEVIQNDWREKNVYSYLDSLYDEIWVYGNREIYDPVEMYQIPKKIHSRIKFTGYIPRKTISQATRASVRKSYRIMDDDKFILVTTGGGGDGLEVIDHYLAMHDYFPTSLPLKSIIITGPFMPKKVREVFTQRAKKFGIKILPFHARLEELMSAADLVVCMGGYNTICEVLTQQTPALIIPRETPRKEQLIRAKRLKGKGLLDFIPWTEVTPQLLREKIFSLLNDQQQYKETINSFKLSGLDTIRARLIYFKEKDLAAAIAKQPVDLCQVRQILHP